MSVASNVSAALLACVVLAISAPVYAADAKVNLPGGGALVLSLPAGWNQAMERGRVPTISLSPASGAAFQVMVSPLVSPEGRVGSMSSEEMKRMVQNAANEAKAQAVEKSIPVQQLKEGQIEGAYFTATDRAPKPGEFKYMTQGVMSVQGLPVTFTILTNDDSKSAQESAMRMLRSARRQ